MSTSDQTSALTNDTDLSATPPGARGTVRALWAYLRAGLGALAGLAPHVMHHVGLIAGAALFTGVIGNTALYLAGLALSIPMLNRLRKRFGTWTAPLLGVAAFTGLFLLSALVIGPALYPGETVPTLQPTVTATPTADHTGHHPDTGSTPDR